MLALETWHFDCKCHVYCRRARREVILWFHLQISDVRNFSSWILEMCKPVDRENISRLFVRGTPFVAAHIQNSMFDGDQGRGKRATGRGLRWEIKWMFQDFWKLKRKYCTSLRGRNRRATAGNLYKTFAYRLFGRHRFRPGCNATRRRAISTIFPFFFF